MAADTWRVDARLREHQHVVDNPVDGFRGDVYPPTSGQRWLLVVADVLVAALAAAIACWGTPRIGVAEIVSIIVAAAGWPLVAAARRPTSRGVPLRLGDWSAVTSTGVVYVALLSLAGTLEGFELSHASFLVAALVLVAGSSVTTAVYSSRARLMQRNGSLVRRVLAVGRGPGISALVDSLAGDIDHPYVVVGACVEGHERLVEDIPLAGRLSFGRLAGDPLRDDVPIRAVLDAADRVGADAVLVVPGSQFTGNRLRALSWALDDHHVELVTALGLVDVDRHRMRLAHAGSVALLHVASSRPARDRVVIKAMVDRLLAAFILLLTLPVFALVAAAVRLSGPGPVLYRQTRVGRDGRMFTMFKFRTMHVDADKSRPALLALNESDGLMFKMRDDPRITPIGKILRKYSVDELPQLINVVCGHMSLVGPRPPLPEEVDAYDSVERRRLRTMPGMTGLWQVSGRSDLSWDESIRLDLRYVDNQTLGGDLRLLGRTASVVVRGEGAY